MTAYGLRVAGLSAWLGNRQVFSDVDLVVPPGSVCGLVGPNGSGKTTFLRCVFRGLRPRAGEVLLIEPGGTEHDVWRMRARDVACRVAAVTQHWEPAFEVSVRDVVAMGRYPHLGDWRRETATDESIVDDSLALFDLTGLAGRPVSRLSGGERQRVLLARAIAQQPGLLLLDEPTSHLDLRHQLELVRLVAEFGVTTMVALHDLDLAARTCDRLAVLNAGRIVAAGTPEGVLTTDRIAAVWGVHADVERDASRRGGVRVRLRDLAAVPAKAGEVA